MSGENWTCKIEKMVPGVFKTEMTWTDAAEEKPTPKKRGRRKKPVAAAA